MSASELRLFDYCASSKVFAPTSVVFQGFSFPISEEAFDFDSFGFKAQSLKSAKIDKAKIIDVICTL